MVFLILLLCLGGTAAAQCTPSLNPNSIHVTAAKATGSFTVNGSASNCPWTAKSNANWILLAYGQSGGNGGSVGYTIENSTLYTSRTGTISVSTASATVNFTVTQDAFPCAYTFNPVNATIQPPGGNQSLAVGTTCTWTASTTTSWIDLNAGSGTTGNGTLSFTVSPNNAVAARYGSILINNQTYQVTQFGTGCNYTVDPAAANYGASGGMGQVTVQTDSSCQWSVQSPVPWINNISINGMPVSTPSGNATVAYSVDPNTGSQSRTNTLTVAGQSVMISQAGVGILLTAQSVVNGASFLSGQIAPGELITIFGSALGPTTPVGLQLTPDGSAVTTSLGGTRVLFDGAPAPLTYVSDGQVNAIVPYELAGDTVSTQVQVEVQGTASSPVTEFLTSASPAIFTAGGGTGQAAALNQDNSPNAPGNPASIGTVLQVYMTGAGQTNPAGVDGQLATTDPAIPLGTVTATIGGVPAPVQYAGSSYGLVAGVTQVNVVVPQGVPTGDAVPLVIQVGATPSPAGVSVAIQ